MKHRKKTKPTKKSTAIALAPENPAATSADDGARPDLPREINGPKGLEPTRYGDWESKGRCHDF